MNELQGVCKAAPGFARVWLKSTVIFSQPLLMLYILMCLHFGWGPLANLKGLRF